MRRKKQEQEAPASGDRRVAPEDIQQVEFRLAFRGYNERDVDAFLDRITEDLSTYLEENQRLRGGAGLPLASPAAEAEAQDVLARAREEAAATLRRAEEDAAAIRAAAGVSGAVGVSDTRAAVAPFLNQEREFLQSLGGLVQGHAEGIKQMVLALRARSESAPATQPAPGSESSVVSNAPGPVATSPAPIAPASPAIAAEAAVQVDAPERSADPGDRPSPFASEPEAGSEVAPASASEIADRLGMSKATGGSDEGSDESEPVVIESSTEPAYSSEGAPAGERRERSLRELFWGED